LSQNCPNPFSSATSIDFQVPKAGPVTIKVYDILGQLVKTVFDSNVAEGCHKVQLKGIDEGGRVLADGVYFCRMEAGDFVETRKLLFVK
jgi:flagellar hook assembly protein FlgD